MEWTSSATPPADNIKPTSNIAAESFIFTSLPFHFSRDIEDLLPASRKLGTSRREARSHSARNIDCILMCSSYLLKASTLGKYTLQKRIVVEHINFSRMHSQTLLQIRHHAPQSGLGKGIKEKQHDGLNRKSKLTRILANQLDRETALCLILIFAEILVGRP